MAKKTKAASTATLEPAATPRMLEHYTQTVRPHLEKALSRTNPHAIPKLEKIGLGVNLLSVVPVAALAGATALTELDLRGNEEMQVEEPLDALLQNHPRLREVRMWKLSGSWSRKSGMNLASFAVKLGARNPDAPRLLFEAQ